MQNKKGKDTMEQIKVYENILDILMEYAKKGKEPDISYIETIITMLYREKKLQEEIKKVEIGEVYGFSNHEDSSSAAYTPVEESIIIDIEAEKEKYDRHKNLKKAGISDQELNVWRTAMITEDLLHEVRHAEQMKRGKQAPQNLEDVIYRVSFYPYYQLLSQPNLLLKLYRKKGIILNKKISSAIDNHNILIRKYSSQSPFERDAELTAKTDIQKILSPVSKQFPTMMQAYKDLYLETLMNGYDNKEENNGPTIRFLQDVPKEQVEETLSLTGKSLEELIELEKGKTREERMRLGINIPTSEYGYTENKLEQAKFHTTNYQKRR